jgi:hypothetical protein
MDRNDIRARTTIVHESPLSCQLCAAQTVAHAISLRQFALPPRHYLGRGVATDMLREVAVAYGKLAGRAAGDVFPQLKFAVGSTHRTGRGRADDLLPPEQRRHYHPWASRQRGRRRHAILREASQRA